MSDAPKKTQVLIGMPCRRFKGKEDVPEHVQQWYAKLVLASQNTPYQFHLMAFGGGNVARGRNKIVADFLRGTWSWLSFVDDDVLPEPDDFFAILARRLYICGALYTTKSDTRCRWVLNTYREPEIDDSGLLPVPELGTGGIKTYHRSVFEKLIKADPGLAYTCDESAAPEFGFFCQGLMDVDGRKRWLPEDYWLDQLCRKHGIPVFVDTRVKIRHMDLRDGQVYPLNDEWPRLPGPTKPVPVPETAEDFTASPFMGNFIVCLQFWEGDKAAALRLARFIADLEPEYRHDVDLCLVSRGDVNLDDPALRETVKYVEARMGVSYFPTSEHIYGYPQSPNLMAMETMHGAGSWFEAGATIGAVLLMEADCIPVARDWINQLKGEWTRVLGQGKLILGSWRAECSDVGHINGNLMFHPNLVNLIELGPVPKEAWDVALAPVFARHWMRTGLIANRYKEVLVTDEAMATPECGTKPPVLVHGIKDQSAWKYAQKMTGIIV